MGAKCVAVRNDKGGVGKTTDAIAFATEQAQAGHRVLAIDWDKTNPSFTQVLMTDDEISDELEDPNNTVCRLVTNVGAGISGLVRVVDLNYEARYNEMYRYPVYQLQAVTAERGWQPGKGIFHFIPGHQMLGPALDELSAGGWGRTDPTGTLRRALSKAREQYDWIVIDMGPGSTSDDMGLLNALTAADAVLFPLNFTRTAQTACKSGLQHIRQINEDRLRDGRRPLQIAGISLFKYDAGDTMHAEKLSAYRRSTLFRPHLLTTVVPEDKMVEKAQEAGVPVQLFAPMTPASIAYNAMAKEIVSRVEALVVS